MSNDKQAPLETFRGTMIANSVAAALDMGMTKGNDLTAVAVAGYMAMRLDRYIEMLEGLIDGEDLVRVQALIAERYKTRREEA
ncbi:MAG TPA: hypothetical protein PKJ72_14970 [Deltaproteobacteria bacterium]|nr:hypothetical protein [Deltaproteobacteria bacterium]